VGHAPQAAKKYVILVDLGTEETSTPFRHGPSRLLDPCLRQTETAFTPGV